MNNSVLEEMIFLNQKISTILSKLYILEEEANFYRLTKKTELHKNIKQSIEEKYNSILKIQLDAMELSYDKNDERVMFYREMIFSVNDRIRISKMSSYNSFSVIYDKLYSSIAPQNNHPNNIEFITDYLIENNFTTIIDFTVYSDDSEDGNPVVDQKMRDFHEKKDYKINYSFFKFIKHKIDLKKTKEVIIYLDKLITQNEKIHLHSENDDTIIGIILSCYLLKNKIVNLIDVIDFVNYLRSLSKHNAKELILNQEQISFISQFVPEIS